MAERYAIMCDIQLAYSKNSVELILEKAEKAGCSFYLTDFEELNPAEFMPLSLKQAIEVVYLSTVDETMHLVTVKYKKTYSNLHFFKGDDMGLMLGSFFYPFLLNEEEWIIDFDPYIRLMLDLISGYQIVSFSLEKN